MAGVLNLRLLAMYLDAVCIYIYLEKGRDGDFLHEHEVGEQRDGV